jgi:hypothetical protein
MEAFLAEFKVYAIATDKPEAMERLRVWRSLAIACDFDPGSGTVRTVAAGELPREVAKLLEQERAKTEGPAPAYLRTRAVQALASHFDGDLGFAGELVGEIEQKTGPLPAALAHALADGRKTQEASS